MKTRREVQGSCASLEYRTVVHKSDSYRLSSDWRTNVAHSKLRRDQLRNRACGTRERAWTSSKVAQLAAVNEGAW